MDSVWVVSVAGLNFDPQKRNSEQLSQRNMILLGLNTGSPSVASDEQA